MTTMQATLATPAATELLPLIPELALVGAAFALLMLDLFLNEKQRVVTHLLAVASLVLVAGLLVAGVGGQGTVLGGGRYDGLIEQLGGKPAPACGFAMGVERLIALLKEEHGPEAERAARSAPDVYVVHQGEIAQRPAFNAAEALRGAGFDVLFHCGGGSFKSQMKRADASGAQVAVIVGDDEAREGSASLKPLREDAPQKRVPLEQLADEIGNYLYGDDNNGDL